MHTSACTVCASNAWQARVETCLCHAASGHAKVVPFVLLHARCWDPVTAPECARKSRSATAAAGLQHPEAGARAAEEVLQLGMQEANSDKLDLDRSHMHKVEA